MRKRCVQSAVRLRFHKKREEDHFTLTSRYLEELTGDLDLVFLCSPDNPTGQCIDEILLREIIERCEKNGIRLVLDECFFDFTEDAPWIHHEFFVKDHRMLFLLRAFTKMFSIPGVRSGYGVCSDTALLDRMKEARQRGRCPSRHRRREWRRLKTTCFRRPQGF